MCLVSVIIPYFNSERTLLRALDSVRNQTLKDFEIILINDGSIDTSENIVEDYSRKYNNFKLIHLRQSNFGPSEARNKGIRHSSGQYIAFLDSDDSWEPNKLEIQVTFMEKHPDVAISGTNCYIVAESKRIKFPLEPPLIEARFYRLLFKVLFLTPTVVIRREVFFQDGFWFNNGKKHAEDLLLFLQISRRYRGVRLSEPLASIYKLEYGESGLTADLPKLLYNEIDNLRILRSENDKQQENKIDLSLHFALIIYSYLKHCKRIISTRLYRIKKSLRHFLGQGCRV